MARKPKKVGIVKQSLPNFIELIDEKRCTIREFTLKHAQAILTLQKKSGLGTYTIYNTQLYRYDEGSNSIKLVVIERSEGDTIAE